MKSKDKVLIIVVIFFSAVFSLLLSNVLIAPPKNRQASVEVVGPITDEFNRPDERFFNEDSINPTQTIRIGDSENQTPFNTGAQN